MACDLQKLTSEYCATKEIDRILQQADSVNVTELTGLRARVMRRQEILHELTTWINVAEDSVKSDFIDFVARVR